MWRIYLSFAAGVAALAVALIQTHDTVLLVLGGVLLGLGATALWVRRLARNATDDSAMSKPFGDSD